MTRIKDRARRKAALSDRKSAAAQARMKSIANLAADDRMPKKKRKGGGGKVISLNTAFFCNMRLQRICLERTTLTGRYTARLCVFIAPQTEVLCSV
jgi:hypothetical protein